MLHTIANLKDSVAAILSGIDINNVENLNGALERSARTLVQQADIPEACGTQNITLYGGVYDYLCDTKIFGTAINDVRPQGVSRTPLDYVYKQYGDDFDRTKAYNRTGTSLTFEYVNGVPIVRIVSNFPRQKVILDQMNDTSGWTAGGSASGLTQDTAVFYQSPASLRFTLTGSSTGTLTKTLSNTIDLSSYENVGVSFLAIRIPDGATATDLTSIALRLGSDGSNYNEVTETEGFLGTWISGDWLVVAFDFAGSPSTGTPDWSNIDYVQVRLAHTGTFTNFRVGGLWISQPCPAQILYQSAAIFIPSGSTTPITTITANTDTIVLNDPAYTLYEYESALAILQQSGGGKGDSTYNTVRNTLYGNEINTFGLYGKYRGDNPSDSLRTVGSYYDTDTYGSFYG